LASIPSAIAKAIDDTFLGSAPLGQPALQRGQLLRAGGNPRPGGDIRKHPRRIWEGGPSLFLSWSTNTHVQIEAGHEYPLFGGTHIRAYAMSAGKVILIQDPGIIESTVAWVRIALQPDAIACFASTDGRAWIPLGTLPRQGFEGAPSRLVLGNRCFCQARKAAGLPKMTSHTLRHFFISQAMMSKDVTTFTISKWVGHRGTRMIEEVYARESGTVLQIAVYRGAMEQ
jgi:hypothetical protein